MKVGRAARLAGGWWLGLRTFLLVRLGGGAQLGFRNLALRAQVSRPLGQRAHMVASHTVQQLAVV
mgnify:CR=1 FL=1